MKKISMMISILLTLISVQQAQATGVLLDSRFDNVGTSYNDAGKAAALTENASFQGSRARLLFSTKINEELSAKLRLNLLAANDTPSTESKFSKYIDYAFITHQVAKDCYITAGKVIALIGGREAIINPADYYFVSMAGGEILGRPLTALWPTGAIFGWSANDQKVELLMANTTNDDGTGQTRYMTGISYLGSFSDKKILPIISYHTDAEAENTKKRTYMAVGSRFIMDAFELDLDYLNNAKDYNSWTANASKDMTSMVASLRYKMSDMWNILAKVDSSKDNQATTASTSPAFADKTYSQLGLAAEYRPYSDINFRYHLAIVKKDTKPDSGDTQTETKLIAGLRLSHDLLK